MQHKYGFHTTLEQRNGLYYLPVTVVPIPDNMELQVRQTAQGTIAMLAPMTMTPTGAETM